MGDALKILNEQGVQLVPDSTHCWSKLYHYYKKGWINRFDLAAAEQLHTVSPLTEPEAAFVSFTAKTNRLGHTAVRVDPSIHPSIELTLLSREGGVDITDQEAEPPLELVQQIQQGAHTTVQRDLPFLVKQDKGGEIIIQFERVQAVEQGLSFHFQRLMESKPKVMISVEQVGSNLPSQLLPEQKEAIVKAIDHSVTLITGGPGTGKTFVAGKLIEQVVTHLDADTLKRFSIAVTAPTGKAASQLQTSLAKTLDPQSAQVELQPKTLHSLLGMGRDGVIRNDQTFLPYDFILLDESSMVDVNLMAQLLKRIKSGARLVMMGDVHQLPSVEGGAVFRDLLKLYPDLVVSLNKCLRAEGKEIIHFAESVKQGNVEEVRRLYHGDAIRFQPLTRDPFEQTVFPSTFLGKFVDRFFVDDGRDEGLLSAITQFRVLTPFRSGKLGVKGLNQFFLKKLLRRSDGLHKTYIPIMIVKNSAQLGIYNGDLGLLVCHNLSSLTQNVQVRMGDYALFKGRDGKPRRVPSSMLPPWELGFTLSIHKSQGSEFDHVLIVMPERSELFGRQSFYTAVTRARKQITLLSNAETLEQTVKTKSERVSGLLIG